jgi:ATP-dependent DNA ligase
MSLRPRALPVGFIAPCLPTRAPQPPSGAIWLHEIKWDGFRVIARKEGKRVTLYSRPGNDLTHRFPLIVEALARLRARILDGEAVACGADGIASFDRIRYRRHDADVFMWAFDPIELNGDDLRRDPLGVRWLRSFKTIEWSVRMYIVPACHLVPNGAWLRGPYGRPKERCCRFESGQPSVKHSGGA